MRPRLIAVDDGSNVEVVGTWPAASMRPRLIAVDDQAIALEDAIRITLQ